jgi:hypothetical protein
MTVTAKAANANVLAIFLFIDHPSIMGFQIRAYAVKDIGAGSLAI